MQRPSLPTMVATRTWSYRWAIIRSPAAPSWTQRIPATTKPSRHVALAAAPTATVVAIAVVAAAKQPACLSRPSSPPPQTVPSPPPHACPPQVCFPTFAACSASTIELAVFDFDLLSTDDIMCRGKVSLAALCLGGVHEKTGKKLLHLRPPCV